jgi:poly-gamma-glutamate synthesis protein (capsule biosynthesis protein)
MRPLLSFAIVALAALAVAACGSTADAPSNTDALYVPGRGETIGGATASTTPMPPGLLLPLTVADVFPPRDLTQYGLDPARIRTVIATGDVIPARYTDKTIRELGNDFNYTVDQTKQLTAAADITVINLEAPLVSYCPLTEGGFTFCGQPGFTEALQTAGVDVVTLENNHISNYGYPGVEETQGYLDAAGMKWADRSTAAIVEVRGMKFGFLAFNAVGEVVDRDAMVAQIQALRPQVDVLSVAFHWGAEYLNVPTTSAGIADDYPPELGYLAIDAGADLIIGNHPHWVQGVEVYKGKFIAYAHGNFIFDQMWSYETRLGVLGKYTFYDDTLIGVEYTPMRIDNYAQPVPLTGQERQDVLDTMRQASADLAAGIHTTPGA